MPRTGSTPGTAFTGPLYFTTPAGTEVASVAYTAAAGLTFESTGFANAQVVKRLVTRVNAAGGGVAQTTAIGTVPVGAVILGVLARVVTVFNGDAATTFEVGVAGNIDNYIDTVDFNPTTANLVRCSVGGTTNDQKSFEYARVAIPVIATWTNNAAASTGEIEVTVLYI
jgi:hypothetical protein